MNEPVNTTLPLPPWIHNAQGEPRRIGIEIEMGGLELDAVAATTAEHFGLTIAPSGRYERRLHGDPAGEWVVELDFNLLKEMGREPLRERDVFDEVRNTAEHWLHQAAERVVPVELVSPPLPMSRLPEVESLIGKLRDAGALGSSERVLYAFGMQFNPEIPNADIDTLTAYMKAFLCLSDWLVQRVDINMTRRLTTYVDPFPADYVQRVVDPYYRPSLSVLIDDYLRYNPTRNRALDWLPLFAHLDSQRVAKVTQDPLIKPRPTLHYRLPNCEIHLPGW
ncbi:MAG: amidoligase family protein, partial [Natronospirillum sp.]